MLFGLKILPALLKVGKKLGHHAKKHWLSHPERHIFDRKHRRDREQNRVNAEDHTQDLPGEKGAESHHTLIHITHKPHYTGSVRKAFGLDSDDDEEPKKKKSKDYLSSLGAMMKMFNHEDDED
jgi:hypothetical protein